MPLLFSQFKVVVNHGDITLMCIDFAQGYIYEIPGLIQNNSWILRGYDGVMHYCMGKYRILYLYYIFDCAIELFQFFCLLL